MLLNGGELDGVRLLSPTTVELDDRQPRRHALPRRHSGFGLGFEVIEDLGKWGRPGSVGEFGWGGAYHTTYWVDPVQELVAVLMTQMLPADGSTLHETFRALIYASVVGPPTGVPAPAAAAGTKKSVTK